MRSKVLLAALTAVVLLGGCQGDSRAAGYASVPIETARQALAAASPSVLVDVREPDEFAAGRVPGAVNVPLATVAAWAQSQPKDRPYLIICRSGRRSLSASQTLVDAGFTRVTNVEGGTLAWEQQGLPLER